MSTTLTDNDKARIEAEEQYRAQIRSQLENTPKPETTKPEKTMVQEWEERKAKANLKNQTVWGQLLYWVGLAFLGISLGATSAYVHYKNDPSNPPHAIDDLFARLSSQPQVGLAESAELVLLQSSDKYGLSGYFILKNGQGVEIAGQGKVKLSIKTRPFDGNEPVTLLDKQFHVSSTDFFKGYRGLGSFKRDVVAFQMEDLKFPDYAGASIEAELSFLNDQLPVAYIKAREVSSVP
jgi:hypothetical protein